MQSDIFNKNPDNSSNMKGIQGYKNSSNVFNYTEPNQISKGIRDYHLQSDILFQKNPSNGEKVNNRGVYKNSESKIEPKKEEKNKKDVGREFLRTYDEWELGSKKLRNIKISQIPIMD